MIIRQERMEDNQKLYYFVKEVFESTEMSDGTEQDFMVELRESHKYINELALVAEINNSIVGHIMLTAVEFRNDEKEKKYNMLLLAPLSVKKEVRNQGIGKRLITEALKKAELLGYDAVFLLGHIQYYQKIGFVSASAYGINTTMELSEEYRDNIMVYPLKDNLLNNIKGTVLL